MAFSYLGSVAPSAWATVNSLLVQPSDKDGEVRSTATTTNYGITTTLNVRGGNAASIRRMILSFNLTAIPAGAKIEDATVSIRRTTAAGVIRTLNFHRVTNTWLQGTGNAQVNTAARNGVTWWERQYGNNLWTGAGPWDWATVGGDYAAAPSASLALPAAGAVFYNFGVTTDTQAFVDGTYVNNGWVVKDSSEVGGTNRTNIFASNNNGTAANRPKIGVTYIIGDTTITPGSAYASTPTAFTVRLTNTGGASGDQMNEATFTIPAGYTAISSASASATAFGKTWTITTQPGAGGPTIVKATASSAANDLTNGEYVDVDFTATTPSSPGLTTWNSGIKGAAGGWYSDPTPATVMISSAPDTTPPTTTLSTLPLTPDGDNGWFSSNPTIILTADEPGATYYKWGSTGTTQTYSGSFTGIEGQSTLYYWSVDTANNTETPANTQAFKVDTALPTDPTSLSSSSHTTGTPSNNPDVVVDFSGATDTASGVEGYSISWSQGATETPPATLNTSASVSTTTSPSLTPDDSWWVNLRTKDNAGNWTSTKHLGPFIVDTTAPVTTFSAVPGAPDGSGGWYISNPQISLSRDETGSTYYKWESAGTTQTYAGSFSGVEGESTLYYWSVDAADNTETPANTQIFKVDTGSPTDPTLSSPTHTTGTPSNNPAVTVDLTGADDTGSGVSGYSISWTNSSSSLPDTIVDMAASENSTTSAPLADGTWYAHLRTVDVAGNWTATAHLGPFIIDTTPPSVDSVSPTDGQSDVVIGASVVATFSEDMDTDTIDGATFTLKDGGTPVAATVTYSGGSRTATLTPTADLDYGTTYTARLSSGVQDIAGNALAPYTFSFTTVAPPDVTPPVTTVSAVPGAPDGPGGWYVTDPAISLSRDETGTSFYQWDSTGGAWTTYGSSFSALEGAHTLYYYSIDTAGNTETVNNESYQVDTAGPSAPTLTGTPDTTGVLDLSWTVATDTASGVAGYRIYNADDDSLLDSTGATSYSFTGLLPDTTYRYYVKAYDSAGNLSAPSNTVVYNSGGEGGSPHGMYTAASKLCELCHQTHENTSVAGQRREREVRIEEDNLDFSYTGAWTAETGGSRSASSSVDSSETGAIAELTFNGTRITWLATKTPASGRARVTLDGLVQADIDLYSPANDYQAAVWQKSGLAQGSHTITIKVLGTKQAPSSGYDVDLDAVDLRIPKVMLLRGQNEKAVCYTCHSGTGSSFNTAEQFGETSSTSAPVSKHPVPQGIVLCSDCHSPHAVAENWDAVPEPNEVVRLLRAVYSTFLGFVIRSTNPWLDTPEPANVALGLPEQRKLSKPYQVCGSCHGAGSTLPGGDLLRYYDYGGSKHDSTVSVSPDTKAEIACMSCHESHASALPKLLETTISGGPIAANDNTVCYACHLEPAIVTFDTSPSDVHGATDSTKTPGSPGLFSPYDYRQPQIRCAVCHSPHGTQSIYWIQPSINATSGISVDGTTAAERGQWQGFCAACHSYTHDSTATYDTCVDCHFHGAGNDSSTTTRF